VRGKHGLVTEQDKRRPGWGIGTAFEGEEGRKLADRRGFWRKSQCGDGGQQ
jgi:hypothetical protein